MAGTYRSVRKLVAFQDAVQFIQRYHPLGLLTLRVGQHQQMIAKTRWIQHGRAHLEPDANYYFGQTNEGGRMLPEICREYLFCWRE